MILTNHRNSDHHWIAHFLTFDRVSSQNLDDSKPQVADVKDFENIEYLLNKDELEKLRRDFIVLVARVLKEFFKCVKALYSEKTAHRVLHGQFVNPRGGEGKNYANDLKMEHCIQDNKQSMRAMRGNKTLKAVQRSSSSSYGQKEFCVHFDRECDIPPDSTRHTHACTTEDVRAMITIIQQTKPFNFKAGRKLLSFPQVSKSPLDKLDVSLLHSCRLSNNKRKLFNGESELNEESAEEEGVEDSGDEHDDSSEEDV